MGCKPLEIKYKAIKAVEARKKQKIEIAAEFYYFSVPLCLKNIGADTTFAVNVLCRQTGSQWVASVGKPSHNNNCKTNFKYILKMCIKLNCKEGIPIII